jgi:hypothetical protein
VIARPKRRMTTDRSCAVAQIDSLRHVGVPTMCALGAGACSADGSTWSAAG